MCVGTGVRDHISVWGCKIYIIDTYIEDILFYFLVACFRHILYRYILPGM